MLQRKSKLYNSSKRDFKNMNNMKLRCLFFAIVIVFNSNSFVFAQSERFILYEDAYDFVDTSSTFTIPTIRIVNGDTIYGDTIYQSNHGGDELGLTGRWYSSRFNEDARAFFDDYLNCLGICRDSSFWSWDEYWWLEKYSKSLPHNNTILVMEPTGKRTFSIKQCKINGYAVDLVFDTGASNLMISPELENELKLSPSDYREKRSAKTANGNILVQIVNIKDFEIGGIHLKNVEAAINPYKGTSVLLGQSVLGNLFAYTIIDDRFIILKENPNYNLSRVKTLVQDIYYFFQNSIYEEDNANTLNRKCGACLEDLLELERICGLDALHLLYLATCYYEIGEYEKCIRTCNRYIYTYENRNEKAYKRMCTSVYSLQVKSMYYNRAAIDSVFPLLKKMESLESYMDTLYYRSIKYLSAICNYYKEDYEASEKDLKYSVKDLQCCISNNYGYRSEDTLLSKMFFDFSLWSYEIGEKRHGDSFLRSSYCIQDSQIARDLMQKHPALYTNSSWECIDWKYDNRLEVYDLYLSARKSRTSTPLIGNQYYKIQVGEEENWQYYFYDRKTKMIVFDE